MLTDASLKLTVRRTDTILRTPSCGFEPRDNFIVYMEGSDGCIFISLVQRCFGTSDLSSIFKGYVVTAVVFGVVVPSLVSRVLSGKKIKRWGVPVTVGGEEGYAIRNAQAYELIESPHKDATTAATLFKHSCKKHSRKLFHGTRKLIERELVTDSDGRKLEKLHLGNYAWQTYAQVFDRACNFASGLIKLGHDVSTRAAIFADTRSEWFIAFQGCFRQNITVVTIYSSLGEDALIHSLNETQVSTLICDSKHLKKMLSISSSLNTIKNVIYFEDEENSDADECRNYSNWTVASFSEVEKLGLENRVPPCLPSKNDTAVIMYTSGSTGLPKGVMITHGNIVASTAGIRLAIPNLDGNDVYIASLPLAHVYELLMEFVMMTAGAQIGYSSPLTLTDNSSKIKKGTKGDISVLKPTIVATVPAIIDRFRDAVYKKVEEKGGIVKKLFDIGFKRRLAAAEGSWFGANWGLERMFWDNIIFKNFSLVFGGRVRYILCSGAPLSPDSQRFINICMCAPVVQAYGTTETCGAGTIADGDDTTVGRVGRPYHCCYIKLVSWKDGGCSTSDRPMPRGEIVVGGPSVTSGYFKNQEKTDEVYKVDENGIRWFYTGDIGRFHPDGCLEIIDRKKDIVKLQHGEYISLGKIEATLISSNYVDRIMVYADPFHSYCIALIVPVRQELEKWAQEAGVKYINFSELCGRAEAVSEVQQSLIKVGKAEKLAKYEIPRKIYLAPDPWTPESGLVTAALKLKREPIKSKFKSEIERLYA